MRQTTKLCTETKLIVYLRDPHNAVRSSVMGEDRHGEGEREGDRKGRGSEGTEKGGASEDRRERDSCIRLSSLPTPRSLYVQSFPIAPSPPPTTPPEQMNRGKRTLDRAPQHDGGGNSATLTAHKQQGQQRGRVGGAGREEAWRISDDSTHASQESGKRKRRWNSCPLSRLFTTLSFFPPP